MIQWKAIWRRSINVLIQNHIHPTKVQYVLTICRVLFHNYIKREYSFSLQMTSYIIQSVDGVREIIVLISNKTIQHLIKLVSLLYSISGQTKGKSIEQSMKRFLLDESDFKDSNQQVYTKNELICQKVFEMAHFKWEFHRKRKWFDPKNVWTWKKEKKNMQKTQNNFSLLNILNWVFNSLEHHEYRE